MSNCLECGELLPPPSRNGSRERKFCSRQHKDRFNGRGRSQRKTERNCVKCDRLFYLKHRERTCRDCSPDGRLTDHEIQQISIPLACKLCEFGVRSSVAASGWECRGGIDGGGCMMQCRPWSQRNHYEPRRMTA